VPTILPAVLRRSSRRLAAATFAVLASSALHAQTNTSFGTGASLAMGHTARSHIGPGATEFWFKVTTIGGRSYCAETAHQDGVSGDTDAVADTFLEVFASDGTTLLASNDDTGEEPANFNFSRACWIPTAVNLNAVKLRPFSSTLPTARSVQLRVVETTLFCPWFFIAGDYNAFSLIRNTSSTPLTGPTSAVVTWRGLSGAVAGTTTVSIPANGGVILNARDFVNPALFSNGTIEIACRGSLDQLQGSTTTLSGTTGLGFDAQFTQRRPW
jgi:hypothetical protein